MTQEEFVAELVKSVSRELCNPLTIIKTAVKLLQIPNLKPSQRQHYLLVIGEACERQNRLIQSLTELTTLKDVQEEATVPLVLADVVPAIVSTYQPLAQEKGVMLAYTVPMSLPIWVGVPTLLRKIVVQLVDNALQATSSGGRIWLTVTATETHICLEVRDSGVGIPAEEIPKIFERFYRVPQRKGVGIGMGLTIVQQLVRQAHGEIAVQSEVGKGTCFQVRLPLDAELSSTVMTPM
ncbi:MAG: hypothetical protein OHK0012_17990 [Synechococcales cyanobacterium]